MSRAEQSIYDSAGAELTRLVRTEAYRRRDLAAAQVDWADHSPAAQDDYRRAEARRIAAIDATGKRR